MIEVIAKACLADVHFMLKKHLVPTLKQYPDIGYDEIVDKLYDVVSDELYRLFIENIKWRGDNG